MRVSHECLHQWIYAKPQRDLDLRQYLPRGRRRRARRKGRKIGGAAHPDARAHLAAAEDGGLARAVRPLGVRHRDRRGPSRVCIDTQVERKSRRPFARLVPDKSAMATARAEYEIYRDLPVFVQLFVEVSGW